MQSTPLLSRHTRSVRTLFGTFGILALLLCSPFSSSTLANDGNANVGLQRAVLDFDGDNKTDFAVVRDISGTYTWYLQRSMLGFAAQPWGSLGDQFVPADYDGDLKWDIAVFRPGTPSVFYIFRSATGTLQTFPFGIVSDDPRCTQDFDGDGIADPTVIRRAGGTVTWYFQRSLLGFTSVVFGSGNDATLRGDFDGDGKADVAVYRPGTGTPANTFFVRRSSDGGVQSATFGNFGTDFIVPADFDGDGKTDYAVWRGFGATSDGNWYWLRSSDGGFRALNFGTATVDRPTPGDYDGDGITDQSVWRPGTPSVFYVNRSSMGFLSFPFGTTGDIVPAHILQAR